MTSEKESWWKGAVAIITALAVLITAVATLLPVIMDGGGEESGGETFRPEEQFVEEPSGDGEDMPTEQPMDDNARLEVEAHPAEEPRDEEFRPEEHPTEEPSDDIRRAEELAAEWVGSLNRKDIEPVVNMADTPFYCDQGLLMRTEDVEAMYRDRFSQEPGEAEDEPPRLNFLQAKTIAELEREGYPDDYEWVYSSLHLTGSDVAVIVVLEGGADGGGFMLAFRRVEGDMRMVGLWWHLF